MPGRHEQKANPLASEDAAPQHGADEADSGSRFPMWFQMLVAVFVATMFTWLVVWVIGKASGFRDRPWTRLLYLYGGIQTVLFTVIGAIFGTTVQPARRRDGCGHRVTVRASVFASGRRRRGVPRPCGSGADAPRRDARPRGDGGRRLPGRRGLPRRPVVRSAPLRPHRSRRDRR